MSAPATLAELISQQYGKQSGYGVTPGQRAGNSSSQGRELLSNINPLHYQACLVAYLDNPSDGDAYNVYKQLRTKAAGIYVDHGWEITRGQPEIEPLCRLAIAELRQPAKIITETARQQHISETRGRWKRLSERYRPIYHLLYGWSESAERQYRINRRKHIDEANHY